MVSELQYIDYFTHLATQHLKIRHDAGKKDAFFFIPLSYDLSEIDSAIRNTKSAPMMALDAMRGTFGDNESENHVQTIEAQITILDKAENGKAETIRSVQDTALQIGFDIITRLKQDCRKKQIFDANTRFAIRDVRFDPVGPMAINHYGYTLRFSIACPFDYTVDSGTWLDK
jgi:hypothetical protein